jgi:DNA-binding transcriptional MerR regulator
MASKHLTTGDIAKLCNVCPRTVVKWCDSGLLPHIKLRPSRHRWITPQALVEFLRQHNNPIPEELQLCVGSGSQ